MDSEFTAFCQGLGLSSEDARIIKDKLDESTTYQNTLDVASTTAKLALGEDRVIPPTNKAVVNVNWSLACVAEPHCIIQPEDAQDVSKVMKIVKHFKIRFAVRSGGHSPNPGWSSVESTGVLIDLQRLNQVVLSSDKALASLGPGGRWGEVIKTLDNQGATVIGARGPGVGVAGTILGGGLFHLTEFGLGADNVKNFEVVLADGTIINANSEQNSDLFWALKGGGPNFGVVTRFDLYTVPVREVWYNVLAYSPDQAPEVIDAFVQYQKGGGSSDVKTTASLIMGIDTVLLLLVYGASQPHQGTFEPFYDVKPYQVIVPAITGTFSSLTDVFALVDTVEPMRHDYRGISTRIDAQLDKEVYKFWREKALAVREATGANQIFSLQPISANVAIQGIAKGGNPMGIPQEDHQCKEPSQLVE
ncbi:hypothetical protein SLS62_004077 [Diatrype stigma]|uniref:FAD-binding PCMH-type domain-containing protein n=1 Tax=Diatrype stigma TaxID=117547 RepID=A0AAN9YPI7_9PEZI